MAVATKKATVSSVNAKIKESIVARFLDHLEQGPGAWKKGHEGAAMGAPSNMLTGAAYTGVNALLLGPLSPYSSGLWITFKQLQTIREEMMAKGSATESLPFVRKGEQGTVGVFAKRSEYSTTVPGEAGEEQSETKASFLYKQFVVFNAEQIENCPAQVSTPNARPFESVVAAEMMLEALREKTGLKILHSQGNYYSPGRDEIHLFPKQAWDSEYDYYSTAAHEAVHCTLSAKRLNRTEALAKRWGDQAYSMEELRAEIGSMFVAMNLGLSVSDDHIRNHAAYVASWRKNLSSDPSELFRAISDATKCSNYLLDLTRTYVEEIEMLVGATSTVAQASARAARSKPAQPGMSA